MALYLDDLPEDDRNSEIQELSARALQEALPTHRWILREEPQPDRGVDFSIELKINGGCTNVRAQLQLKGTESTTLNGDGSASHSIEVSNLKYLLNGQSGLYILYIIDREELRWVWARDERRRLDEVNPNWDGQKSVTLRLSNLLNPQSLDEIAARIQKEAQSRLRLEEILGNSSVGVGATTTLQGNGIRVSIAPDTLELLDSEEAYGALVSGGVWLVTSGLAGAVLETVKLLSPNREAEPSIQLMCAYANQSLSRYFDAIGHLGRASLRRSELLNDDREFLDLLRNVCDLETGRIDLAQYEKRNQQDHGEEEDSAYSLAHQYEVARRLVFESPMAKDGRIAEMQSLAKQLEKRADVSSLFKIQTRLHLLHPEGACAISESFALARNDQLRGHLTISATNLLTLVNTSQPYKKWESLMNAISKEIFQHQNSLLLATFYEVRAIIGTLMLGHARMQLIRVGYEPLLPSEFIQNVLSDTDAARQLYAQIGRLESELRMKIQMADLYEIAEQREAAKRIAEGVLPQAQALSFQALERRALQHIEGNTIQERFEKKAQMNFQTGDDLTFYEADEAEIRAMARQTIAKLGLSVDQLPRIEREIEVHCAMARERFEWCQHLDLLENNLTSTTSYSLEPKRVAFCRLHKYQSAIALTDWRAVTNAFKTNFCSTCADKCAYLK